MSREHNFRKERQSPARDPSKLTKHKSRKKDKPIFRVFGCRYKKDSAWNFWNKPFHIGYAKTVSEAFQLTKKCKCMPYYRFDYAVIYKNNTFFDCVVFVLPNKRIPKDERALNPKSK